MSAFLEELLGVPLDRSSRGGTTDFDWIFERANNPRRRTGILGLGNGVYAVVEAQGRGATVFYGAQLASLNKM